MRVGEGGFFVYRQFQKGEDQEEIGKGIAVQEGEWVYRVKSGSGSGKER